MCPQQPPDFFRQDALKPGQTPFLDITQDTDQANNQAAMSTNSAPEKALLTPASAAPYLQGSLAGKNLGSGRVPQGPVVGQITNEALTISVS